MVVPADANGAKPVIILLSQILNIFWINTILTDPPAQKSNFRIKQIG